MQITISNIADKFKLTAVPECIEIVVVFLCECPMSFPFWETVRFLTSTICIGFSA